MHIRTRLKILAWTFGIALFAGAVSTTSAKNAITLNTRERRQADFEQYKLDLEQWRQDVLSVKEQYYDQVLKKKKLQLSVEKEDSE